MFVCTFISHLKDSSPLVLLTFRSDFMPLYLGVSICLIMDSLR
jgi:hypothetical protein